MAISRVPGYSLLANLDRQGTDLYITSSGQILQYWDVVNYRVGINNSSPQYELDVSGNIITSNGHIYTGANLSYNIGTISNWWGTVYAANIQSTALTGTLLTNSQPNITSVGTISNLSTTGNTYLTGNTTANGNLTVTNNLSAVNISAVSITGNLTGNLSGYVLQGDQPYISNLSNITVSNITVTGGNLNFAGNVSFTVLNSQQIFHNGNLVLDTGSNISVSGDVFGFGSNANINVSLPTTGVQAGTYQAPLITVDAKGRVTFAANAGISQVGNLFFSNTTISSDQDITLLTNTNGNIYLNAGNVGIVRVIGSDAFGLPAGDDSTRPPNPSTGYLRFSTTRQGIEYWDGTGWASPGQATISSQIISPDGAANTFALSSNTTVSGVLVSINGTIQRPVYSYDIINNNQIQFTETPLTTDIVEIRFMAPTAVTIGALSFGGTTAVTLDAANVNVMGNIIPTANVTYSLGSADKQWKDLWVSNNTIYIGGTAVTVVDGKLNVGGNEITPNLAAYSGDISANNVVANSFTTVGTVGTGNIAGVYTLSAINGIFSGNVITGGILTDNYYYANGTPVSFGGSSYSNVQVATYLPTYSGNVANVRLGVSGILTFPDGTTQITAAVGGGSSYGNANVAAYLPTYTGTVGASLVNSSGNILGRTLNINQITATGIFSTTALINTSANLLVGGTATLFGNTSHGRVGASTGAYHNFIGNITQSTSGGDVYFNTTGNILCGGNITAANITTTGNVLSANVITGNIVSATVVSTANTTIFGNLRVYSGQQAFGGSGNIQLIGSGGTAFLNLGITPGPGSPIIEMQNSGVTIPAMRFSASSSGGSNITLHSSGIVAGAYTYTNLIDSGSGADILLATRNLVVSGTGASPASVTMNINGTMTANVANIGVSANIGNLGANTLSVSGNVSLFGNTRFGTAGVVSGAYHNFVGNINQYTSGGNVYFNTTGNIIAADGTFNTLTTVSRISYSATGGNLVGKNGEHLLYDTSGAVILRSTSGNIVLEPSSAVTRIVGSVNTTSNLTVGGSVDISQGVTLIGTTTEEITSNASVSGTYTINYNGGVSGNAVHYWNAITSNVTVNITNMNTANNLSTTFSILINQGATPYVANVLQVGGVAQTIKWLGATTGTGTANNVNVQSFTLLRYAGSWIVLSSITPYG